MKRLLTTGVDGVDPGYGRCRFSVLRERERGNFGAVNRRPPFGRKGANHGLGAGRAQFT